MKVKELIKILEKENPENYVGRLMYGQDTGDYANLDFDDLIISSFPDSFIDCDDEKFMKLKRIKR